MRCVHLHRLKMTEGVYVHLLHMYEVRRLNRCHCQAIFSDSFFDRHLLRMHEIAQLGAVFPKEYFERIMGIAHRKRYSCQFSG